MTAILKLKKIARERKSLNGCIDAAIKRLNNALVDILPHDRLYNDCLGHQVTVESDRVLLYDLTTPQEVVFDLSNPHDGTFSAVMRTKWGNIFKQAAEDAANLLEMRQDESIKLYNLIDSLSNHEEVVEED